MATSNIPTARLGRTGLHVSRVCLGTMTFGGQCDEATSRAILDTAEELGITFIDAADVYPIPPSLETAGTTEVILGAWLRGKRDRFDVATKCFNPMGPGPNNRGNSRVHMIRALEASLKRLGTDYIDLYQIHRWDDNTAAWQLMQALWTSDLHDLIRFDSLQPRYNVLYRNIEAETVPACIANGVGIIVYNPLAAGMLTAKYRGKEAPVEGTRFTLGNIATLYQQRYWQQETLDVVTRLADDVASRGKSLTHVALRWALDQPGITAAIVGATRPEQLRDTLGGVAIELDDKDRAACDAAWFALPRRRPSEEG